MEPVVCPGCLTHLARISDLEQRIAALEARLGTNSTNSSVPPSANPLGAPKPVSKKKSKRRRGGQPGRPPHLKRLFPPGRVDEVVVFRPTRCGHCHADLPAAAPVAEVEPVRFQVVEIPPIVSVVTEYQGAACSCPSCGEAAHATIPAEVRAHGVGPRLTAALSYFSGCHGMSKRGIEEVAEAVFGAPIASGTVANPEGGVGAALASAHQEALEVVRGAEVKNVDETSWKRGGKLCWLWAAATAGVAAFVVHARRGASGLTALLGEAIEGIVCSDRWGPYDRVPEGRRQVCWAHLKRASRKGVDRGGTGGSIGEAGLRVVRRAFAAWHAYQKGEVTREGLKGRIAPVTRRTNAVPVEGCEGGDPTVATFCNNLLELEQAMGTFARVEGVEPTNNHIERLLRRAVLWRKRSFGSQSERGCRFVERILTVVQTRRLRGEGVLEFLRDAVVASRAGLPCPRLVPEG